MILFRLVNRYIERFARFLNAINHFERNCKCHLFVIKSILFGLEMQIQTRFCSPKLNGADVSPLSRYKFVYDDFPLICHHCRRLRHYDFH